MNPRGFDLTLRSLTMAIAVLTTSSCATREPLTPIAMASEQQREAEAALRAFLTAFENLDWVAFTKFFAEDATAFLPSPEAPRRFDGKAAIEGQFRLGFSEIRQDSGARVPPFHKLEPVDLRVEAFGNQLAVATFLLVSEQRIARRTLILRRDAGGWRIIHLHASTVRL